jgi:hypothetical protein
MEDWLTAGGTVLAVVISAAAFWRTLDQVTADLLFEWEPALDRVVGKLAIDNPPRQSVYLRGIRFKKPARQSVRVSPEGSGLHDTISEALETHASPDQNVAVVNVRIPPRGRAVLNMYIEEDETDLEFSFVWSKTTPWAGRILAPRDCSYSATELKTMKRAAKRGERPDD